MVEILDPVAGAQLEAADLAEGISPERGDIIVDETKNVFGLGDEAGQRVLGDEIIGIGVDDALGRRAPIEPALVVEIAHDGRRVDEPGTRERGRDERVVAQHVAPIGRDPAGRVCAEAVGADGDVRRRDIVQGDLGLVRGDGEVRLLGQAEERVPQQAEQGALGLRARREDGRIALELGQEGLPFEDGRIVDRINGMVPVQVAGEDDPAGLRGDREGRAEIGDARDPSIQVRDLGDLGRGDIDPVDVGLAALVGQEVEGSGIGRPLGIDVLAGGEGQELLDRARLDVEEGQLVVPDVDPVEVGREPLGDEGDGLPVRRPDRLQVAEESRVICFRWTS
jgi:hypothetical protein